MDVVSQGLAKQVVESQLNTTVKPSVDPSTSAFPAMMDQQQNQLNALVDNIFGQMGQNAPTHNAVSAQGVELKDGVKIGELGIDKGDALKSYVNEVNSHLNGVDRIMEGLVNGGSKTMPEIISAQVQVQQFMFEVELLSKGVENGIKGLMTPFNMQV